MPPVKEPYLKSLLQVATAALVTPTLCSEDSAPQQRLKTKWCFILSRTPSTQQALHCLSSESQPCTCYFDLAEMQLKDSCNSGCLSLTSCLELKQESPTLPLNSPFPPRRLCEYTKQARLTGETGVILLLSSCSYMGDKLSQNYPLQAIGFSKQVWI